MNCKAIVILLLFLSPLLNAQAEPNLARVVFLRGDVSATEDLTNIPRKLRRDSRLEAGETIMTADKSIVQLVFPDRSMLHIRANSKVKLEKYRFHSNDQKSDEMVIKVLKGGMRSLTGILGKRSKDKVQFQTPVATIGIRGTATDIREQSAAGNDNVSWAVTFDYGSGFVENDAGKVDVETGDTVKADTADKKAGKTRFTRDDKDPAVIAKKLVEAPDSEVKPKTQQVCKLLATEDALLLMGMENQVPGFTAPTLTATVEGLIVCMPLESFKVALTTSVLLYTDTSPSILKAAVRGGVKIESALESVMRGLENPDPRLLNNVLTTAVDLGISKQGALDVLRNLQTEGICL